MRPGSVKYVFHGRRRKPEVTGVLLDEAIAEGPVDLASVFGNARPVEVEISPEGTDDRFFEAY